MTDKRDSFATDWNAQAAAFFAFTGENRDTQFRGLADFGRQLWLHGKTAGDMKPA